MPFFLTAIIHCTLENTDCRHEKEPVSSIFANKKLREIVKWMILNTAARTNLEKKVQELIMTDPVKTWITMCVGQ